jgi:hypothetical protein
MILTLEDLMDLAEKVAVVIEKVFILERNCAGWTARYEPPGLHPVLRCNDISYGTAKEAIIAALKAVKPKG